MMRWEGKAMSEGYDELVRGKVMRKGYDEATQCS